MLPLGGEGPTVLTGVTRTQCEDACSDTFGNVCTGFVYTAGCPITSGKQIDGAACAANAGSCSLLNSSALTAEGDSLSIVPTSLACHYTCAKARAVLFMSNKQLSFVD